MARRGGPGGGGQALRQRLGSWHPLSASGWHVTPALAYFAKALTLGLIVRYVWLGPLHFVPFVEVLDAFGSSPWAQRVWQLTFFVGAAGVLLNRWPRASVFVLTGVLLYVLAASRVSYHNNTLFVASAFLMIGLSSRAVGGWLIRLQIAVVYFGAAFDKAMAPWWRDGTFMDNWLQTMDHPIYAFLTDHTPELLLALAGSWAAILTEFLLAGGVLIPPIGPWVAWIGASFHSGTFFLSGNTFGLFMVGMITSYLCFADLDLAMRIRLRASQGGHAAADAFRRWTWPDRPIEIEPAGADDAWLTVDRAGEQYRGLAAAGLLAVFNPAIYVGFLVFMTTPLIPQPLKLVGLVFALLASVPLILAVTLDRLKRVSARRGGAGAGASAS